MSAQENAEGTTSIGKDDTTPASSPQSSSADLLKDASSGSAPNSPSMRPASLRTSNDSSEPESPSPEPGANAKKEKKMKKSKSATLKREGNKEDVSESGEKKTLRTSTKVKKKSAEDKQEEGKQPLAHSAEISIKKSQSEQDIKKHAEVRRTPSVEDKKSKEENPLKRTPSTERKEKGEGASGLKRSPSTEDTKEKKGKDEEVKRVPSGEKKKEGELKRVPSDLKKLEDDAQPRKGKFSSFMSFLGIGKKKDQENNAEDEGSASSFSSYEKQVLDVNTFEELPPEMLKALKKAGISDTDAANNLMVVLNMLHFHTKASFKQVSDLKKQQAQQAAKDAKPPPPASSVRPKYDEETLITPGDPKDVFKMDQQEGKGGFGTVFRAYRRGAPSSADAVAIKIMPNADPYDKRTNLNELGVLRFCRHANIVSFLGAYKKDNDIWCILEFMEGGTLEQAVKHFMFNEKQIAYVARECLQGLAYLHSENLIHRDLKSSNIMLTVTGGVKLIDFGLCVDISNGKHTSMVGSPFWMAPEMIQRRPHDFKVDIWSLGICMMELANGHPPNHKSVLKAMFTVATQGYPQPFEQSSSWGHAFQEFTTLCLNTDPDKRPMAKELLQHEFIQRADTAKSMEKILRGIFVLQTVLPF